MFKNLLKKRESGFTIIEVLIVLAIAGLILVVVLVAIPQLQRNQRNEDRRAKVARITTEIGNYAGNNNGNLPTMGGASPTFPGFVNRYLGCGTDTLAPPTTVECTVNIRDPQSGNNFSFVQGVVSPVAYPTTIGEIRYYQNGKCSGEDVAPGSGTREFAVVALQEGGARVCLGSS